MRVRWVLTVFTLMQRARAMSVRSRLAGTVCGGMKTNTWFIENSIAHGAIVFGEILKREEV